MSVNDIWMTTPDLCKLAKNQPNDLIFFIGVKLDKDLYNNFLHKKELKKYEELGLLNDQADERAYDFARFLDKVTDRKGTIWVILANNSHSSISFVTADYERKSRKRRVVSYKPDPFLRYLVRVPAELLAKVKARIVKRVLKLAKMHNFPIYAWDSKSRTCKIVADWDVK